MDTILLQTKVFLTTPIIMGFATHIIAFMGGCLAGFVTFSTDFADDTRTLLTSIHCMFYMVLNGIISLVCFIFISNIDIVILSVKINDHLYLSSCIIGILGFKIMADKLGKAEDQEGLYSGALLDFIGKIKNKLYESHSRLQNEKIRPQVWEILKNLDNTRVEELIYKCVDLARNINEEKGEAFGVAYNEQKREGENIESIKMKMGTDLTRIIGLKLLRQAVNEVKGETSVLEEISSLDKVMNTFRENRP